jgi:Na+/proline symporter
MVWDGHLFCRRIADIQAKRENLFTSLDFCERRYLTIKWDEIFYAIVFTPLTPPGGRTKTMAEMN